MKRFLIAITAVLVAVFGGAAFSLRPQQAAALPDGRYVALGDSVAAGLGLAGSNEYPICGRSAEAYPVQVAATQNLLFDSVACSGATAKKGLYGMQTVDTTVLNAQLDTAFAPGTPQLLTITIGANDVHWSEFVKQCYAMHCGTKWDSIRAQAYLLDLRWRLYRTLSTIEDKSGDDTPPRVILTGYFDPAQGQTCAALPGVDAGESAWLSSQVQELNQAISDAADWYDDFATYAPVDFSGHGICSPDSWVQGLADAAPAHPTAAGQTAIAQAVVTTLSEQ